MRTALRIGGHPVHAFVTHVPIGLLVTTLLWDVLGLVRGEALWWAIAFWVMAAGVAAAIVAAATGVADLLALRDEAASAVATRHMSWVLAAVSAYAISLGLRGGAAPPVGLTRIGVLLAEGAGLALLSVGGWLGGELVYRHRVGAVESH